MKGLLLSLLPLILMAQEPRGEFKASAQIFTAADPHEYEAFIEKLDQFNRKLGGCPSRGSTETCYPPKGTFDAKLWKDLRKLAKRIFSLPAKD